MSDGLGTFENLLSILGNSSATAERLGQLKQATEEARQARDEAVKAKHEAEAAHQSLAEADRKSEAASREQGQALAKRLVEIEAREKRVAKT
jgi:hypothetical protein